MAAPLPLAAACSGGGADAPPAQSLTAAPAAQVRAGGTQTWAVGGVPATLNVHQTDADAATRTVAEAVLPALFPPDSGGRPTMDQDYLVKAVSKGGASSDDASDDAEAANPQTVVYTLNPQARWSDGKPLSAADFAGQWKALRGTDPGYWTSGTGGYDAVSDVTAGPGAHQVTVSFKRPFADWRALFTPLYPAAATKSPEAFNDGLRRHLPATAGPFRLAGSDAVDDKAGTVTLERDPKWWGTRARLDKLVLKAVPAEQRLAALKSGSVDLARLDTDAPGAATLLRQASATHGITLHKGAGGAWTQLTLNGGTGPLKDGDLRRAVARAIDRNAIAKDVAAPLGMTAFAPGNHLLMGTQAGYSDNSSALGSAGDDGGKGEVQKALKAAGDAVGTDAPVLRVVIPKNSAQAETVAKDVHTMLAKAGLRSRTVAVSGDGFFTDHVATGDFDLAVYSWPATAFPVVDDRAIYAKPQPSEDGSMNIGRNWARTGTDEIDLLFRKAGAELDTGKASDLRNTLDARLWREAGSLPLFQVPDVVATRANVVNAGAFGVGTPDFTAVGFRK
ncbi:ABC transporter family substrate-binding protein [Mangrovactinospora gilvigrisea]|uniref:ABC transporter family substrate-binding protein n=1 Tax=Mangrovactinospora gilvigrisea TaxID=1428644 RepID=UPI001FE84D13|nr:ABC transporter family substrate-binding protein [Mangrovactinospora gilvigrisea]